MWEPRDYRATVFVPSSAEALPLPSVFFRGPHDRVLEYSFERQVKGERAVSGRGRDKLSRDSVVVRNKREADTLDADDASGRRDQHVDDFQIRRGQSRHG